MSSVQLKGGIAGGNGVVLLAGAAVHPLDDTADDVLSMALGNAYRAVGER